LCKNSCTAPKGAADPVTVELVTSTQHKVSLKKVIDWMAHAGGKSPKETAMKARVREG
jgi:hypothetical protein